MFVFPIRSEKVFDLDQLLLASVAGRSVLVYRSIAIPAISKRFSQYFPRPITLPLI